VLIHGSRLTRAVWRAVSGRLAGEFRVIAIDLPGHGSRAEETFTLAGAAAAVAAVIDEAAGGRAVVVGHSLGGYAAMELAATAPARVRGLVIVGASQEPSGRWRPAFEALAWLLASPLVGGLDRLNDRYLRRRYPPEIAEPVVAGGYWTAGGAAGVRGLTSEAFLPRLAAYPGRTLIVNGELDLILRLGARTFRRAARHGRARVIPHGTHLVPLDAPDRLAATIAEFARSLEP
jgi:pimeloyl-ACP methyl ester carboxylesterase